ncbi:MAG: hypothetical protein ACK4PR_10510, partial [Gammaproteobacteria bacterium]
EPATNAGIYTAGTCIKKTDEIYEKIFKLNSTNDSEAIKTEIAQDILNGVTQFVPGMSTASIIDIRVGHVKVFATQQEDCSIYKEDSKIHERNDVGMSTVCPGVYEFSGMKMIFTMHRAKGLLNRIGFYHTTLSLIKSRMKGIKDALLTNDKNEAGVEKKLDEKDAKLNAKLANIIIYNSLRFYLYTEIQKEIQLLNLLNFEDDLICVLKKVMGSKLNVSHQLEPLLQDNNLIKVSELPHFFYKTNKNSPNHLPNGMSATIISSI